MVNSAFAAANKPESAKLTIIWKQVRDVWGNPLRKHEISKCYVVSRADCQHRQKNQYTTIPPSVSVHDRNERQYFDESRHSHEWHQTQITSCHSYCHLCDSSHWVQNNLRGRGRRSIAGSTVNVKTSVIVPMGSLFLTGRPWFWTHQVKSVTLLLQSWIWPDELWTIYGLGRQNKRQADSWTL